MCFLSLYLPSNFPGTKHNLLFHSFLGSQKELREFKEKESTWWGLGAEEARRRISTRGTTKAKVFPEPVAASTATSLKLQSKGMVAAWTGVQKWKPDWVRASRTGSDSGGLSSENRVVVRALFGSEESAGAAAMSSLHRRFKQWEGV